jgi:ribose transport system permease protein
VVTLCGLLLYRGIARYLTNDNTLGFGSEFDRLRYISVGHPFSLPLVPMPFVLMIVIALAAAVLLNQTIYGRYLLALGRNEQAARYSGINTHRITIMAYVICSVLAGLAGVLFALDVNSIQPAGLGEFYELYAIAAAVLGGCSLRGGEGTIFGVIIGAAVIRVLYNAINILGIPTQLDFAIIGLVILGGVITDEVIKRIVTRRRAARIL